MNQNTNCPQCGSSIPVDAPAGICPRCVFGVGMSSGEADHTAPFEGGGTTPGFSAPSCDELRSRFPQLEIIELLGVGGMGAVYRAKQISLDRVVALKVLPKHTPNDAKFRERFQREARALARLTHPNIVMIFDFGHADGFPYFVMEYVDGVNLREAIRDSRLTTTEAFSVVRQVCDALQFAHDEGIVHRDIKPENVLLDRYGRVKIADFGLAKLVRESVVENNLTGTQQVMGTVHYMAPEQMEAPQTVDHRADIYSLGVVFYELLTGELPIGRFDPPSARGRVDARLDEVVLRTLAKEPARRYQHASELGSAVESASSLRPAEAAKPEVVLKSPVVSFTQEADMGWPNANGLVRCDGSSLLLEAQIKDLWTSFSKPNCTAHSIPISSVSSIEFVAGPFGGGKLTIIVDSLVEAAKFPISEAGKAILKISASDRKAARNLSLMVQKRLEGVPWNTAVQNVLAESQNDERGDFDALPVEQVQERLRLPLKAVKGIGWFNCIIGSVLVLIFLFPVLFQNTGLPDLKLGLASTQISLPFSASSISLNPNQIPLVFRLVLILAGASTLAVGILQQTMALCIQQRREWGFVLGASIVTLLPLHLGWIPGIPIAIWTVIAISPLGVRTSFRTRDAARHVSQPVPLGKPIPQTVGSQGTPQIERPYAIFSGPGAPLKILIFFSSIFFLLTVLVGPLGFALLNPGKESKESSVEKLEGHLDQGMKSTAKEDLEEDTSGDGESSN